MIKRYLIPILITIQIVSGQPTPDSIDPVVLQKADKENVKVQEIVPHSQDPIPSGEKANPQPQNLKQNPQANKEQEVPKVEVDPSKITQQNLQQQQQKKKEENQEQVEKQKDKAENKNIGGGIESQLNQQVEKQLQNNQKTQQQNSEQLRNANNKKEEIKVQMSKEKTDAEVREEQQLIQKAKQEQQERKKAEEKLNRDRQLAMQRQSAQELRARNRAEQKRRQANKKVQPQQTDEQKKQRSQRYRAEQQRIKQIKQRQQEMKQKHRRQRAQAGIQDDEEYSEDGQLTPTDKKKKEEREKLKIAKKAFKSKKNGKSSQSQFLFELRNQMSQFVFTPATDEDISFKVRAFASYNNAYSQIKDINTDTPVKIYIYENNQRIITQSQFYFQGFISASLKAETQYVIRFYNSGLQKLIQVQYSHIIQANQVKDLLNTDEVKKHVFRTKGIKQDISSVFRDRKLNSVMEIQDGAQFNNQIRKYYIYEIIEMLFTVAICFGQIKLIKQILSKNSIV